MLINLGGIQALKQLRFDLQESAGHEFPHSQLTEMLVLYDVSKALGLSVFQAKEVLGEAAYDMVAAHINSPAVIPTDKARQLLAA